MKSAGPDETKQAEDRQDIPSDCAHHFRSSRRRNGSVAWNRVLMASFQHVMQSGVTLAHHEIRFAQKELARMATHYRMAAMYTVAAAALMVCGFFLLLSSLVFALNTWLDTWLACLVVGVFAWMLGIFLYGIGKDAMALDHALPFRTAARATKVPQEKCP